MQPRPPHQCFRLPCPSSNNHIPSTTSVRTTTRTHHVCPAGRVHHSIGALQRVPDHSNPAQLNYPHTAGTTAPAQPPSTSTTTTTATATIHVRPEARRWQGPGQRQGPCPTTACPFPRPRPSPRTGLSGGEPLCPVRQQRRVVPLAELDADLPLAVLVRPAPRLLPGPRLQRHRRQPVQWRFTGEQAGMPHL